MTAKQADRPTEGGREGDREREEREREREGDGGRESLFLEAWCVSQNVFISTGSKQHNHFGFTEQECSVGPGTRRAARLVRHSPYQPAGSGVRFLHLEVKPLPMNSCQLLQWWREESKWLFYNQSIHFKDEHTVNQRLVEDNWSVGSILGLSVQRSGLGSLFTLNWAQLWLRGLI